MVGHSIRFLLVLIAWLAYIQFRLNEATHDTITNVLLKVAKLEDRFRRT